MLAERKRKVIYSTNPKGLDWVKGIACWCCFPLF